MMQSEITPQAPFIQEGDVLTQHIRLDSRPLGIVLRVIFWSGPFQFCLRSIASMTAPFCWTISCTPVVLLLCRLVLCPLANKRQSVCHTYIGTEGDVFGDFRS